MFSRFPCPAWRPVRCSGAPLVVLVALLTITTAPAPVASQLVPDGVDRWEVVELPIEASVADLAVDAAGRPYALSGGEVVFRLEGSRWQRVPLRSPRTNAPALEAPPGTAGTLVTQTFEGLLRSDDAGASWFAEGPRTRPVHAVAFDPTDADRWLIVYASGEVARTEDDGASWSSHLIEPIDQTFIDVADATATADGDFFVLLRTNLACPVSGCFPESGLFRSVDGGRTWERRSLATGSALHAAPDGTLFAQLDDVGFARSLDDGATWLPLPVPGEVRDMVFGVDTAAGTAHLAGTSGEGLFRSTDGGASWTEIAEDVFEPFGSIGALAADPTRSGVVLAAVNSPSVASVVLSADGGATWEPLVDGLHASAVLDVTTARGDPSRVLAAGQSRLYLSLDDGASWSEVTELAGFVEDVQFAPSDDQVAYAVGYSFDEAVFLRSRDGGASWDPAAAPAVEVVDLAVSPTDPDLLLVASRGVTGETEGVFRSTDGGSTWARVQEGNTSRVLWDRRDAGTAYALVGNPLVERRLLRSTDRGQTWTELGNAPAHLAAGLDALYGVFTLPGPPTFRRSTDAGATWQILDDPPVGLFQVTEIETGPRPREVYLGTIDGGVLQSIDGGERWNRLVGAPGHFVTDLDIPSDAAPSFTAWASTFGGGLVRGEFQDPPLALEDGRFVAEVEYRTFDGQTGGGRAALETDDTGVYWFFGRENLELMIKVLDGRAVNEHWWVFYGALSNVEFTLTVTDTRTGRQQIYFNPLGTFASEGDVTAFFEESVPGLPGGGGNLPPVNGVRELALGERFVATITWRDFEGIEGDGIAVPLTRRFDGTPGDTGGFWFFDPRNLEMMVKVLDGRAVNGKYWVFFGSLTNVEFTLTVEDTVTGAVREYTNPLGTFASRGDIEAFTP